MIRHDKLPLNLSWINTANLTGKDFVVKRVWSLNTENCLLKKKKGGTIGSFISIHFSIQKVEEGIKKKKEIFKTNGIKTLK